MRLSFIHSFIYRGFRISNLSMGRGHSWQAAPYNDTCHTLSVTRSLSFTIHVISAQLPSFSAHDHISTHNQVLPLFPIQGFSQYILSPLHTTPIHFVYHFTPLDRCATPCNFSDYPLYRNLRYTPQPHTSTLCRVHMPSILFHLYSTPLA